MYPGAYRWDRTGESPPHPVVSAAEAEAIADYFEARLRDPRVEEGVFDPSALTELEARTGAELFREYSCIGCHQILEDGKAVGGPVSTSFFDAGRRYDPDWVWAFNLDPPAFTPHSGEYVADLSERKIRRLTGYLMTPTSTTWSSTAARRWGGPRSCPTGPEGDGLGPMAAGFTPPPRNFRCAETMGALPDGQLFWVVRKGSPGTGMMAYPGLSEEQIWQLVLYLRSFAR